MDTHHDVAIQPPAIVQEFRQAAPQRPFPLSLLPQRRAVEAKRVIAFMLPGGGAHGCFGAAVLATLLTHPDLYTAEFAAFMTASAGSLNGAIAVQALQQPRLSETQRRADAAERVHHLWRRNTIDNFGYSALLNMGQIAASFLGRIPSMSDWSGEYMTRFLEPLISDYFNGVSKPKKHLPQLHVGTSAYLGPNQFEPVVHSNHIVDRSVLIASGSLMEIFGKKKLSDGRLHVDGAYTANPPETPLADMKNVTDVIWIMNDRPDRYADGKPRQLKSAWDQIAPYRALDTGPRHHSIHLDRVLPEYTRIMPTTAQNDQLWKDGVKAAVDFLKTGWALPAYAA